MKKRLLLLSVLLLCYTTSIQGQISTADLSSKMADHMNQLMVDDKFSGTVLIAKDGEPIFLEAYGLASRAWGVKNKVDTKFNLGSMNKMFTAVAITQLMERDKLNFDDLVGKLIPDYPNEDVAKKVTIKHLLTHTSGMGSYFNAKYVGASKNKFRKVNDYDDLYVNVPLSFEPGLRFQYSNSGFMLLGKIIEAVSGKDYFDYIREHIYKPAGMINSDSYELDLEIPNLAAGYTWGGMGGAPRDGQLRNNIFMHVLKGGPAGGGYSTVEDLLSFANALRNEVLISKSSLELLTSDYKNYRYGHGFTASPLFGLIAYGHSGGFPGINSELKILPGTGYTIAVMSNIDRGATPVARAAAKFISGYKPPKAIDLSAATLQEFSGTYEVSGSNGNPVTIRVAGKQLLVNNRVQLVPYAKDKFFDKNNDQIRFYFKLNKDDMVLSFGQESGPQGAWEAVKKGNE